MCVCVCVCVCAFEVVLVGGAVEAAEVLFLVVYAYVLSLVSVILFVIYAGEEEVEEQEQEEDYSGPFLNTATDESLYRAFCPGAIQTGIYGTEYCGASAKVRLGFIREFWALVLMLVLVLVVERGMLSAAFNSSCKDVP